MKVQFIVILLVLVGVATGLAQLGEEYITITVTSEGKAKISQTLFPKTFVSTIDVHIISEKISNLLAIDEKRILLGATQNQDLLKIATLGASAVDLKYNAGILYYESGVFRLKYNSEIESKVILPQLSKLVSLNTIPIEITDREYVLPPGDISLSYTIRPVTSKEFFVTVDDSEQKIEVITAAKIEEFSANSDEIQFIIKDKAIVLTIIPKAVMTNPNDALLNGEEVDFRQFHQNATHSWIRIDPHEKGLVRILDTSEELGGCLIATATYGSEMAPQVQLLREIRDNQLMNTGYGVSFMTGFNQLYYSFSPYIADIERENPAFKELIKITITPMLSSLSIMTFAESENEILGLGIGVILLNIGMYFVLPFVILYKIRNDIRTRGMKKSNWEVISSCNVLSVVKKSLFGIVALLVLTVSVSSAFETAYADDHEDPIQIVLDLTYQNIQESIGDAGDISDTPAETFFVEGEKNYFEALAALEAGDIVAAKENALIAMALFENSAEEIGALENQVSTQLPSGLGAGFDSASDTGITQGQGLGVGGIPQGIAANIFDIQEGITEIDDEINELQGLDVANKVNFEEYDKTINLAKEILANGDIPNAQAKLVLANEIKSDIINQMNEAAAESADERVQQFVDESVANIEEMLKDRENLGLTKKAIKGLEEALENIQNGEIDEFIEKTSDKGELAKELDEVDSPGNSGDAPGQNKEEGDSPGNSGDAPGQNKEEGDSPGNSGDAPGQNNEEGDSPGNSGDAPGQNKKNDEAELPPGFDSASDTGKANGNGNGLGNIPPGQLKKFESGLYSVYSPDDYFDDPIDDLAEDTFEENYDKMYKDTKSKEKSEAAKQAKLDRIADAAANGGPPGLAKKVNDGITDNDPTKTSGTVSVEYVVADFTAIKNGKNEATDKIRITVEGPSGNVVNNKKQGDADANFTPSEPGTFVITASDNPLPSITRTVIVIAGGGSPTVSNTIPSFTISENAPTNTLDLRLVFTDTVTNDDDLEYSVVSNDNTTLLPGVTTGIIGGDGWTLTLDYANSENGVANITVSAKDVDNNTVNTSFTVTVNAGECTTDAAVIGTISSAPGAKNWNSVGDCTIIGDNYDIGNNWDVLDHVRIGDNFSAGNGDNGATDIFAGAIIGDNVNGGTSTVAAGVIIPDGITL